MREEMQKTFQIDSCLDQVLGVTETIQRLCRDYGMDEMNAFQVRTAVTEGINNAILHACANQPGKLVTIELICRNRQVTVEISEKGQTMTAMPPDLEPAPDAENGRGWWIMRRWMDSVGYSSKEGTNRLTMSRKV